MATLRLDADITQIVSKFNTTKNEMEGVNEAFDEIKDRSKAAVMGAASDQDRLAASTKKSSKELGEQSKRVTALERFLKRLQVGQSKTNNPDKIKKYNAEIAKTRAGLTRLRGAGNRGLGGVNSAVTKSRALFVGLRGVIASTFAPLIAVGAVVQGVRSVVSAVSEFEQTAADLSAITGATGDTLEFLKQSAVEVGTETTVSAGQTLEAYKLIASAKPELLDNAGALAEITREAVTLTEAMGGELPQVATDLTDIMNQFGAEADEASRFVNTLAAGSQKGSAEVGQLAQAFLQAGTSMKSANVDIETGTGLIETLAENGRKGAEAGTALRNIITKLSATEILPAEATRRLLAAGVDMDTLSDNTLGFTDRLRALRPIQNDANAIVSLFGLENKVAGEILLNNVDRVDELTAAVTDTTTAQEQAATRTATLSAEWQKFTNTIQALVQGEGGGLGTLLATLVRLARQGLFFVRDALNELRPFFVSIGEQAGILADRLRGATGGAEGFGSAMRIIVAPIKVLLAIVDAAFGAFNRLTTALSTVVRSSPRALAFFQRLAAGARSFVQAFIELPATIAGGLAAIETFIVEASRGIVAFGRGTGEVLKEALNIPKLIRDGRGDLDAALAQLSNPFKAAGAQAAVAFNEAFEKASAAVSTRPKIEAPDTIVSLGGGGNTDINNNTPTSSAVDSAADKLAAERLKKEEQQAKELAKARLDAMQEGVEKELAREEARYSDLLARLEKYGIDSTDATIQHELNKFTIKSKFLQDAADLEGLDGAERLKFINDNNLAEIAALETALRAQGELTQEQVQQLTLLRQNANAQYVQGLEAINTAELRAQEEHQKDLLELRRGEFDDEKSFLEFKEAELLRIRIEFAEKQLALLEASGEADVRAVDNIRAAIAGAKAELAGLQGEGDTSEEFSLFKLVGIDPDSEEAAGIATAVSTGLSLLSELNAARVASAEQEIKEADQKIAATENLLNTKRSQLQEEIALGQQGLSNNQDAVREEIALLKRRQQQEKVERDKALTDKKKAQRDQAIIDTITQGSSLITAAAQVFQSVAAVPFVGPVLGATLVAGMIASFVAAKARIFKNIKNQTAEKGLTGVAQGKRHSDGGTPFGEGIEMEQGERYGILSRGATKEFGNFYGNMTDLMNKNPKKAREIINRMETNEGKLKGFAVGASFDDSEIRKGNRYLKKISEGKSKKGKEVQYHDGKKTITRKHSRRTVKNG